ncbi:MAG: GntR family transcriptional regulator [Actinomycetales bacterium]|nr:GntR family transcriptional regulator [Actinomycetales bacterium]
MTQGRSPSAAERAYETLRARILDGQVPPGTMLGESPLAADLGMSRTPVRAALSRLQSEGWIVIYPKRGALVRGLGPQTVAELAEARILLEVAGERSAGEAARSEAIPRLEALLAAHRDALSAGDLPALVRELQAFHRCFVEAGGNQVLLELYGRLADRHRFALSTAGAALFERGEEALAEHSLLLECFRDADSERFERTLRAHVAEDGAPREAD